MLMQQINVNVNVKTTKLYEYNFCIMKLALQFHPAKLHDPLPFFVQKTT